jgi:cation diffusion facilitator CzcD-associated flavoprotein CzcO
VAEKVFNKIDIFEQRGTVGGVWNLSATECSSRILIPQTDPRYGSASQQVSKDQKDDCNHEQRDGTGLEFESPLYDYLETNIPKQLMAFSDQPFHGDLPLFPGHEAVLEYLERYADDVRHLIQFHTQVIKVRLVASDPTDRWEVTTKSLQDGQPLTSTYDAVVVANGHYTIPYVPDIPGLEAWNNANPGVIMHSKAYRNPSAFTGKKVIVIGNSASGTDIVAQIAPYSQRPLLLSSRTYNELFPRGLGSDSQEDVPEIVEFLSSEHGDRAVRFQDERVEDRIDAVVFATGYFYNLQFLDLPGEVVTDGLRTRDVYQHLFHIGHPSLVFPVLNLKVVPFPLAENQAAVVARVWAGRLGLPGKGEMRRWEGERVREKGGGRGFHVLKFPEDAVMLNMLFEWAGEARREEGLENDGAGKVGMWWDGRSVWMRERFPEIKRAFSGRGDARFEVRALEELGFDYERRDDIEMRTI